MKIIEVTKPYTDMQLGRPVKLGERLEVSDERAEQLLGHPEKIARLIGESAAVEMPEEVQDLTPPLKTEQSVAPEQPSEPEVAEQPESATNSSETPDSSEGLQANETETAETPEAKPAKTNRRYKGAKKAA